MIEPGRSIVGPAGVLLTRVLYRKKTPSKEFVIVDAAMNDLIRPALYRAHHEILPLHRADVVANVVANWSRTWSGRSAKPAISSRAIANSPTCSPANISPSRRPEPTASFRHPITTPARAQPEVLVEGSQWRVVRDRETYEDLIRGESA